MKILATADLHGELPYMASIAAMGCDVVVIAGDICPDAPVAVQLGFLDGPFRDWLCDFEIPVIAIAGNHDFVFEKWGGAVRELILPWHYLENRATMIDGVQFHGIPHVPNLSNWAFHADDHHLDLYYGEVQPGIDVVIAHGPPQFFRDFTVPRYGSQHAGAPQANGMLRRVRPKAYICGHIHEGYGAELHEKSGAMIYNVAHNTENYDPINPPMVIEV